MKVGDRIYYGTERNQHMDEIEKDKHGYYGRYSVNNAKSEHFRTIDELIDSYVKSKYWFYVSVESDGKLTELKNIEELLLTEGKILTEDHCYGEPYYSDSEGADEIVIKVIQYDGNLYYVKSERPQIFTPTFNGYHDCKKSLGSETLTIKMLH